MRGLTILTALALLSLAACGGGGGTLAPQTGATLNAAEQELLGTYTLASFALYGDEEGSRRPADLQDWNGSLALGADGRAHLTLSFCDAANNVTGCDREFAWSADAGLIELVATGPGQSNVLLAWEGTGFGGMTTDVWVPVNRPDVAYVTVGTGRERFEWVRDVAR